MMLAGLATLGAVNATVLAFVVPDGPPLVGPVVIGLEIAVAAGLWWRARWRGRFPLTRFRRDDPDLPTWQWPFAFALGVPLATVPFQSALLGRVVGSGECELTGRDAPLSFTWECPREELLHTLLPGIALLVMVVWLFAGNRRVRWAAAIAGTLGAARLVLPVLLVRAAETHQVGESQLYRTPYSLHSIETSQGLSIALWVATAIAAWLFARAVRPRHPTWWEERYGPQEPPGE